MAIGIGNYFQSSVAVTPLPGMVQLIDYDSDLIGQASTFDLHVVDQGLSATLLDANGLVQSLPSQLAAGQTLTPALATNRPLYVANQLGGRAVARFARDPAGPPDRMAYNFPAATNASWSKVLILKTPAYNGSSAGYLFGNDGAAGINRHLLYRAYDGTNGEHIRHRVGLSTAEINLPLPVPVDTFFLVVASWDAVGKSAAMSINGGAFTQLVNAATVVDATAATLGAQTTDGSNAGFFGDVAMVGVDTSALHLSANAAKLAVWKQFARDVYGIAVA